MLMLLLSLSAPLTFAVVCDLDTFLFGSTLLFRVGPGAFGFAYTALYDGKEALFWGVGREGRTERKGTSFISQGLGESRGERCENVRPFLLRIRLRKQVK